MDRWRYNVRKVRNRHWHSQWICRWNDKWNLFAPKGSLGCWSHLDPITSRLKGVGVGTYAPSSNGQYALKDVVYQDAGIYKCVGQSPTNKKKLEVLNTIALGVKGKIDLTLLMVAAAELTLFVQASQQSQQGTQRLRHFLVYLFISLLNFVLIHPPTLLAGSMATGFTRLEINTVLTF